MTATHTWNYFNGTMHGWLGKAPVPMTLCFCSDCAPKHIPRFKETLPETKGREHWDTGFRCAPWKVGAPCSGCGKDI